MTKSELIRPEDVERVSLFERLLNEWKGMPVTSILTAFSMIYFIVISAVLLTISPFFILLILPAGLNIIMGYKWDSFIKDDNKRRVIDYLSTLRTKNLKSSMFILSIGTNASIIILGTVKFFPVPVTENFMPYLLLMGSLIIGCGACFGFIFVGQVLRVFQQSRSEQSRKKADRD